MNIFGTGIDIVDCLRIKSVIKKNPNFKKRIFSNIEIRACSKKKNEINCYAKKFAAKEAFVKALGVGISKGIAFKEIEITNNTSGKPLIKLHGKTDVISKKIMKNRNYKIFLSISDEINIAIAQVLILK